MARALLVGCGCRGRQLGVRLVETGWQVRGTSRTPEGAAAIERAGIEPALADPDRVATVLEHVADVTAVGWLLASARGPDAQVGALHADRLERLCEELVDTPVRGIVYEAAGSAGRRALGRGREILAEAGERWRIPVELVEHDPADAGGWADSAARAFGRLTTR